MIQEQDLSPADEVIRARNTNFGIRLFLGADASFFLAFVFAYLYLKTIDTPDLWVGASSDGSVLLGGLGAAALLVAAAAIWFGARGLREGASQQWRTGAGVAVLMGVVALVAMAWQLVTIGYNPSGYDSVLIGWTAALALHVLIATPLLVGSAIERRPAGAIPPLGLASVQAVSWFWGFLAAIGLLEFILLDLIR
jgi:heme/copper-type cytochrome/quinol oxidase subunit 3